MTPDSYDDADDAAQETYFRALRALPRFRGDSSFRTWLLRIAVNVCLNWKRDHPSTEPWDEERLLVCRVGELLGVLETADDAPDEGRYLDRGFG